VQNVCEKLLSFASLFLSGSLGFAGIGTCGGGLALGRLKSEKMRKSAQRDLLKRQNRVKIGFPSFL
jgi:hypothetical protein